jgi:hypothetical protein
MHLSWNDAPAFACTAIGCWQRQGRPDIDDRPPTTNDELVPGTSHRTRDTMGTGFLDANVKC